MKKEGSELEQYQRTTCGCDKCKSACKAIPGMLAPGDIENISEFMQVQNTEPWLKEHFVASEGALVVGDDGRPYRIGTITPAQKDDGSCVFLRDDESCMIHPVSPFGCRAFSTCRDNPVDVLEDKRKVAHSLSLISKSPFYYAVRDFLESCGKRAKPLPERRAALEKLLEEIDE